MALTADLLATPLSSGHSPSGTLSGLTAKLAGEIRVAELETDTEDHGEAPSPCAERTTRRIQRKAQNSTSRRNFTIQEYLRVHNSPQPPVLSRAAALLPDTADEGRETEEQARTIEDVGSRDENERLEYSDGEPNAQDGPNVRPETTDPEIAAPATEGSTIETPSFTPMRNTIHEIIQRMREVMESYYSDNPGHAYLLYDRAGESPFVKIGKSVRVSARKGQHQRECQLEEWDTKQRPVTSIPRPMRLERIVQAELRNLACDPSCICGVKHQEYFWVSKEVGLELLEFWVGWLKVHDPYDEDESLKGFWVDRLDKFQESAHDYFRCDSQQCADQDEDTPACQACLRAGWKKWAEPTASDELEYACRESFSSNKIRRFFQTLDRYNLFSNWLMPIVQFLAQLVAFSRWISDQKVFFHLVQLRLMAPWVNSQVSHPGQTGSWVLTVVDMILSAVCLYHQFRQVLEGECAPKRSPKKTRSAGRTSPRKDIPRFDNYRDSSQTPESRDSTRRLAGTKRRRKSS